MTPFEEQYLKGITPRLMLTIIGCTIMTMATVLGTYFDFKHNIADAQKDISIIQQEVAAMQSIDTIHSSAIIGLKQNLSIISFKVDEMYSSPKPK